ncbi:PREDICTED: trihelix transcription factor GT-2-like [Populus euphratica]|uniref:Trihelix transcription factor GT-2-like n=1 Tax=Populus euphratica TaxID=75702 RepID=A0AAJ6Y6E7_POPEU|nr:PREDICTED: trihelix transcription factor GT-2-like [Populus euphratica]
MLGDSSVLASPSDVATTATRVVPEGGEVCEVGGAGGFGSNSTEEDKNMGGDILEGDRMNYGANRWPRQETLALLKIRSAMDAVFRDSSLKGPLWEEVSRKLAELGYDRSAKKCKEKFENLYKYHKRTKEGRTGKSEGKTYKFFDELEAFQNHHSYSAQPPTILAPPLPPPKAQTPTATTATLPWTNSPAIVSHVTAQSTTNPIDILSQGIATPTTIHTISPMPLSSNSMNPSQDTLPSSLQNLATHFFSSSTSSSTASDEKLERSRKRKRERNWKDFFLRLTRDVIKKQEDLQKKFLETVDKCEHERMAREDAWRMKEMARMNRQHEILIQERSTAVAKDAAVFAFLQKISGQQNSTETQAIPQPKLTPPQPRPPVPTSLEPVTNLVVSKWDNGENVTVSSSSRWPKVEVQALISLRADLDIKYQEHGAKGPLWEDISAGMQKLGYNRSAKSCKEKWENINKYFKKVKESNRKRPGDSKTCPYFDQLDALYKEKNKMESRVSTGYAVKPISTMEPLMVRPEQQCPFEQANQPETNIEDNERDINIDHNIEEEEEDDDDMDDDTEEEDEGVGFEVVANRPASLTNGE